MPNLDSYLERFENYQKEQEELNEIFDPDDRRCRVCGCTQFNACPGGCYWIEEDLCSKNVYKKRKKQKKIICFFLLIYFIR
ncbi:hypothetical protein ACJK2Y_00415 (plasmid) [Enterococcus faecalis]|uniref:hypothetical protein n=1 Tax=Enterococcus faecalis TaxID=1351 RepID=UPI003D228960